MIRCIGSGSYGEVWLARTVMGNYRAVKVVVERVSRTIRSNASLKGIQKFERISRSDKARTLIYARERSRP